MSYRNLLMAALLFVVAATGCHKDASPSSVCEMLKEAMINGDREQARVAITAMIDRLPSKAYTEAGLNMLSNSIAGQCGMNAGVFCFNCIKTLPSETEIEVSFMSSGFPVERTIDISYTTQNEMQFVNVH